MKTGRHAIVLAAGAATRFGGGKLIADWRGKPLVVWAVRAALACRVERVTVVLGADVERVRATVATVEDERVHIVEAHDWALGQSASLKAGIRALPHDAKAVVIFLGDMPAVDPMIADRLLDAVAHGTPAARAGSSFGPAHPNAFAAEAFPNLMRLTGDQGGRPVLEALGNAVLTIETDDPGAVFDIDFADDLKTVPQEV